MDNLEQFFKIGTNGKIYNFQSNRWKRRQGKGRYHTDLWIRVNSEHYLLRNVAFLKWEMRFEFVEEKRLSYFRLNELDRSQKEGMGVAANGRLVPFEAQWTKQEFVDSLTAVIHQFTSFKLVNPFATAVNGFPAISDGNETFVLRFLRARYSRVIIQRMVTGSSEHKEWGVRKKFGGTAVGKTYAIVAEKFGVGSNGWLLVPVTEVMQKMIDNIGQFADPFAKRKVGEGDSAQYFLDLKDGVGPLKMRKRKVG